MAFDKNVFDKNYLGDGVYAEFDGYQIRLTTSKDVPSTENEIYLEPSVLDNLLGYVKRVQRVIEEG